VTESSSNTASLQQLEDCSVRIPGWILLLYVIGIVYGSLIPFELRPYTLPEAWDQFIHIRFLDLGVVSRADWIANILLYIPLGFLAMGWLHTVTGRARFGTGLVIIAVGFSSFVAFTVEFTQIFFAPRTVSINDLIAEHLGIVLGIALFFIVQQPLSAGLRHISAGGHRALVALLLLYTLAYLVLSLFPYDFLLSLKELEWKLSSDRYGAFVAAAGCQGVLECVFRFGVEMFAAVPLGLLAGIRSTRMAGRLVLFSFMMGVLLGLVIELGQFLIASGISQGVSIIIRGLGVAAGAWFAGVFFSGQLRLQPSTIRLILVVAAIPYLLAVLALNDWFAAPWIQLGEGLASLKGEMLLPFYYHYFTSETRAVASLIANFAMYMPIGIGCWIFGHFGRSRPANGWVPVIIAMGLAVVVEGGKVLISSKHPDPTNILIAPLAAVITYRFALWVQLQTGVSSLASDTSSRIKQKPEPYHEKKYRIILPLAGISLACAAVAYFIIQKNTLPDELENALALRNLQANSWVRYYQGPMGEGRLQYHAGSVYDSKRGTILVFGSDTHNEDWDNAVHEFDPAKKRWLSHYVSSPPSSYYADEIGRAVAGGQDVYPWAMHTYDAIIYDPVQDALVVTSQPLHNPIRSDIPEAKIHPTWIYDLEAHKWRMFDNAGGESPTFFGGATAYDDTRDVIVAYKGWLWELGPERKEWLKSGGGKGHQLHHTMDYDSWRKKVFVFGNHRPSSDVWSYTPGVAAGSAGNWEKHVPGGDSPPPYTTTPVAFDRDQGMFLLVADNLPLYKARSASTYVYDPAKNVYHKLVNAELPPVGMNYMLVWHQAYGVFFLITEKPRGNVVVWALRLDPLAIGDK